MCILDSVLILYSKYLLAFSHTEFNKYSYTCMPKLSVVLLDFNLVKYLSKTIDSVLLQLFESFEIIIGHVSADSETRLILGRAD